MFGKMKRFILACLILCICGLMLTSLASAAEAYLVTLNVDFLENLIFSRYDVDLYTNNTEQDTLSHGVDYSGSFYLPEGKNTITFYKHNNKGVKGVIELNLTGNTTINCRISNYSSEITVDKLDIQTEQAAESITRGMLTEETEPETAGENLPDIDALPEVNGNEAQAFSSKINFSDIDFSTFTDEELAQAMSAIKAEQRARIKTKIELSSTKESIAKGKFAKLTGEVTDLPEGVTASQLSWSTSDNSIATCQNGNVKAVNPGTATISCTATLSDGTEIMNECEITVYVPVAAIALDTQSLSLGLKQNAQISYNARPADASDPSVTYSSEDPSVAIVSADGVVTPVSIGTTFINVTANDGSNVKAKCKVAVTAKSDLKIPRTVDNVTVTLTGMKEKKGDILAKPESGNIFVIIDYTVENGSKSEKLVSYSDFEAYCDGYKLDDGNTIWVCDNYSMLESLAPGRKLKGQVCFEAPKNWKEIEIRFNDSFWSDEEATFTLYHKK